MIHFQCVDGMKSILAVKSAQSFTKRILRKLGMTVHRCLQGKSPQYLVNCCHPTSDVASRQRLRYSSCHHLVVPRHRRSTLGRRAFSVALPDDLQDPLLSADNFRKTLKTHLFRNALGHLVVVVVVVYLYSASRSASNALIVP